MNVKSPHTLFRLFALVLVVGLFVTACGGATDTAPAAEPAAENTPAAAASDSGTQDQPAAPVQGQEVSASILLDPALATDADSLLVNGYIYQTLFTLDNNELVGELAVNWTISDDGLDYILELRPGVVFQDGSPFNADAVTANFNRWFTGGAGFLGWQDAFGGFQGEVDADGKAKSSFDGIEKVDDLTVLVHLNRADQNFLVKLANPAFSITTPAAGEGYGTMGNGAVGTGPYSVSEWTATQLTLTPFDGFWGEMATEAAVFNLK